jgi:UDP-N-acetyl-D-glucosamine dehydrogenase
MPKSSVSAKKVGVVGLGYVGLPLSLTFAEAGISVIGFDVDREKPRAIALGKTYLKTIPSRRIKKQVDAGRFEATTDFKRVSEVGALIYCVPTPLTHHREPDMSYVEATARDTAPYVKRGMLVVLESTTYPGTTEEVLRPILEKGSGLRADRDFYLAFSPEREDPGNEKFTTRHIPKVVGADSAKARQLALALYGAAFDKVVVVSSTRAAEMVKIYENTFRAVNIALANEVKLLCERMDLDVFEVIEAAATKPFGFMPFYPGPGLGGHCIPIDPFYLTWKAREYDFPTKFIELAGEINSSMPYHVLDRTVKGLAALGVPIKGARVLVLGVAYKRDIDDVRESPALKIMQLLQKEGARIAYHDPYIPKMWKMREYAFDLSSSPLTARALKEADAVVITTDHQGVDYALVARHAKLVVDTRNVYKRPLRNVVKA